VLILPQQEAFRRKHKNKSRVLSGPPLQTFASATIALFQPFRPAPEIHPTAVIHPSTQLGNEVYIGAHVVIQAG